MKYVKRDEVPDELLAKAERYSDRVVCFTDETFNSIRSGNNMPSVNSNISKERFEKCKACEDSRDGGHLCVHYAGCCFGRRRSEPSFKCPKGKW